MTDFSFCPRLERLIETGESVSDDGSVIPAAGLSTINNLRILRGLLSDYDATQTLEIGLAHGASALTILATQAEKYRDGFTHTAVDPYQSSVWKSAGVSVIRSAGIHTGFVSIEESSATVLPRFVNEGRRFDLIYIDGSHIFEDVFVDAFYSCQLAKPGAFIVFDDCTDPHVAKVIRFLDRNYDRILRRHDVSKYKQQTWKSLAGSLVGRQQCKVYRKIGEPPRQWDVTFRNF